MDLIAVPSGSSKAKKREDQNPSMSWGWQIHLSFWVIFRLVQMGLHKSDLRRVSVEKTGSSLSCHVSTLDDTTLDH